MSLPSFLRQPRCLFALHAIIDFVVATFFFVAIRLPIILVQFVFLFLAARFTGINFPSFAKAVRFVAPCFAVPWSFATCCIELANNARHRAMGAVWPWHALAPRVDHNPMENDIKKLRSQVEHLKRQRDANGGHKRAQLIHQMEMLRNDIGTLIANAVAQAQQDAGERVHGELTEMISK